MFRPITIFFLLLPVLLFACSGGGDQEAKVYSITGQVTIGGEEADKGQVVRRSDRVVTGENSTVEIRVGENSIIKFYPNSDALLDFGGEENKITLTLGAMASFINRVREETGTGYKTFSVNTPTMVAGVRGTTFYLEARSRDETYFCTCNGKIHMHDINGRNEEEVEAGHHNARLFYLEGGELVVEQAGMENHTDAELEELAAKVDGKINWSQD